MSNFKVFRAFILVQNFILFIFQSLDLKEEREIHQKIVNNKENY
jgi:hypothetical protein